MMAFIEFDLATIDTFVDAELLIEQFPGLPLDVTTARVSYAWHCRELAILLTLRESLAED